MNKRVEEILKMEMPEQKSKEWFEMRKNRITSSVAACCLPRIKEIVDPWLNLYYTDKYIEYDIKETCNKYKSFYDFFSEKTATERKFFGNLYTAWGQKYEDVVIKYYEKKQGKRVHEIGLLPIEGYDFLAASPDGVCDDGTVIEIKCPKTRQIDGIPTLDYWVQVQFHLQATKLKTCHFIESEIIEYTNISSWENDFEENVSGALIEIQKIPNDFVNKYVYFDCVSVSDYKQNIIDYLKQHENDEEFNIIPCFYKIKKYSMIAIERDDVWFKNALYWLKKAHDKIKDYRENPKHINRELDIF